MSKWNCVTFCAERPDNGPSGGAAGVMYLLREYLDTKSLQWQINYMYKNSGKCRFLFDVVKDAFKQEDVYYICHEPNSAALLHLLHKRYSMVYHQQGPLVQEYLSLSPKPQRLSILKKKIIEKLAFYGTDIVYFPSRGAADEYFNSRFVAVKKSKINVGKALYNTINADEEIIPINGIKREKNCLTFISVGTMSELKGQDLSFEFISKYVERTLSPIRWIIVGDGLIKQDVLLLCEKLKQDRTNFDYIHFHKIPHGSVLYLDSISDIYIMMHRSSIFDLATLEAMNQECAVVLSNIGGNQDFNTDNNIILVDPNDIETSVNSLINTDLEQMKKKNKTQFDRCFSPTCFSNRYINVINEIMSKD